MKETNIIHFKPAFKLAELLIYAQDKGYPIPDVSEGFISIDFKNKNVTTTSLENVKEYINLDELDNPEYIISLIVESIKKDKEFVNIPVELFIENSPIKKGNFQVGYSKVTNTIFIHKDRTVIIGSEANKENIRDTLITIHCLDSKKALFLGKIITEVLEDFESLSSKNGINNISDEELIAAFKNNPYKA